MDFLTLPETWNEITTTKKSILKTKGAWINYQLSSAFGLCTHLHSIKSELMNIFCFTWEENNSLVVHEHAKNSIWDGIVVTCCSQGWIRALIEWHPVQGEGLRSNVAARFYAILCYSPHLNLIGRPSAEELKSTNLTGLCGGPHGTPLLYVRGLNWKDE